jgi:hypothetical protein
MWLLAEDRFPADDDPQLAPDGDGKGGGESWR